MSSVTISVSSASRCDRTDAPDVDLHAHFFNADSSLSGSLFFNSPELPGLGRLIADGSLRLELREGASCAVAVTCARAGHSVRDAAFALKISDADSGELLLLANFEPEACRAPCSPPPELAARGASAQLQRLVAGISAPVPSLFLAVLEPGGFRGASVRCRSANPPAVAAEIAQLLASGEELDELTVLSEDVPSHASTSSSAGTLGLVQSSNIFRSDRSKSLEVRTLHAKLEVKDRRIRELEGEVNRLKISLEMASRVRAVQQADFEELLRRSLTEKESMQLQPEPAEDPRGGRRKRPTTGSRVYNLFKR